MLLVLATLLLAAGPARPFEEERALLARRLEILGRVLPDGPQPSADTALVIGLARAAALQEADISARAPLETAGERGEVLVEVRARGRYSEIDRFFRQAALSPRLIDVESMTLGATDTEQIVLAAVLRLPYRPERALLPRAPDDVSRPAGLARPQLDAYLRGHALALAKTETIAGLRRSRRNPRLFLAELAAVVRDRSVVLTHASLGEEFLIRGITAGETSVRDLEARLEQGFFRMAGMLVVKRGACHRFEARGQAPVVGPQAEVPLPTEDPFRLDDAGCQVDRDPGGVTTLRAPRRKAGAKAGAITVRLRGVDLADAFGALHLATGEAFLVDEDVRGRVDVELDRATLEEALALFTRTGVTISDGPLRRVRRGGRGEKAPPETRVSAEESGPRVSLTLKRVAAGELLALFGEADPSLMSWGPGPLSGRVSVYARDVPAATLRQAVLAALGLFENRDDDRRVVSATPTAGDAARLVPITRSATPRRLVLSRQDLSVREFELAGLAGTSDTSWALVYAPGGLLQAYRSGDRIRDASIVEITGGEAVLSTEEGAFRIPLP